MISAFLKYHNRNMSHRRYCPLHTPLPRKRRSHDSTCTPIQMSHPRNVMLCEWWWTLPSSAPDDQHPIFQPTIRASIFCFWRLASDLPTHHATMEQQPGHRGTTAKYTQGPYLAGRFPASKGQTTHDHGSTAWTPRYNSTLRVPTLPDASQRARAKPHQHSMISYLVHTHAT